MSSASSLTSGAWGACLLMFCLLTASCATRPKPSADWNKLGLWQQISSHPPTYIPTGHDTRQPRTEGNGTWYMDSRDGKRLFVPKRAVRGIEPGVLAGEAKKVTGFDDGSGLSAEDRAAEALGTFGGRCTRGLLWTKLPGLFLNSLPGFTTR